LRTGGGTKETVYITILAYDKSMVL
jgi:hypothetical protein